MQEPSDDAKRFPFCMTRSTPQNTMALWSARSPRVNKNQQIRPAVSLLRRASSNHQERSRETQTPNPVGWSMEMQLYKFREQTGSRTEAVKERTSPWKLGGITLWQLLKRVYQEFDEDEVFTRSAALAFYFVSALVPLAFFLWPFLGFLAKGHDLQSGLLGNAAR